VFKMPILMGAIALIVAFGVIATILAGAAGEATTSSDLPYKAYAVGLASDELKVTPASATPTATSTVGGGTAPIKPNFYLPEPRTGPITDLEQRLLNGINMERANAGLAPYALDAGLSCIARVRVQQLVDQNYFGHTDPFGYSMYAELLAYFGYASYVWAGENLVLNNYEVTESPERAVAALMQSPTHWVNILDGEFVRIGVGELTTADGRHFYAMIFLS